MNVDGPGDERKGKLAGGFREKFLSDRSVQFRLAGTLVGLLSVALPWGSIIVRDHSTHATVSLTSVWFPDLIMSSALLVSAASLLFIAATVAALLDARAVIVQMLALATMFITMPGPLGDIAAALAPSLPEGTLSTTIAMGFYLGAFSAAILLVSLIPFREVGHDARTGLIGSERLRPEENVYHKWR